MATDMARNDSSSIRPDRARPHFGRRTFSGVVGRLLIRRLALTPIILLGVSLAVFLMIDLSPNDPARAKLGPFADAEAHILIRAEYGLDDPLPVRFARFLGDLVHLRLGDSLVRSESVNELISLALPVTLQLLMLSMLFAIAFSLLFGMVSARTEGRPADWIISTAASVFQASPQFWTGLLFIQLFAVALGIVPSGGYVPIDAGFVDWFSSMIGPAIVLALPFTAAMTRVLRASVADELGKDYVRTAIGSGVSWTVVLFRNVLRNALITPITVLGVYVGALMSGAVLVEVVFNLPGMGTLLTTGVNQGDLSVVRGVAIVGAVSFVVVNLVVDLLHLFLNPRAAESSKQ